MDDDSGIDFNFPPFFLPVLLENAKWISGDGAVVGDGFIDYAVCSDDDIVSNGDLAENHASCSNVHIVSDHGNVPVRKIFSDRDILGDKTAITDPGIAVNDTSQPPVPDGKLFPDGTETRQPDGKKESGCSR